MSSNQAWMGIDFEGTDHNPQQKEFDLLPMGKYVAIIKDVEALVTEDGKSKLVVYYDLPDENRTISANYIEDPNHAYAEMFRNNIKNLFSRVCYSDLTNEEYRNLDNRKVNEELSKLKTPAQIKKIFIGKKVVVGIEQSPFISKVKETGVINFTNIPFNLVKDIPQAIKKLIPLGASYSKFPKILFSNKIKLMSLEFISDYTESDSSKRKNSPAYEWWQLLTSNVSRTEDELVGEDEIPFK